MIVAESYIRIRYPHLGNREFETLSERLLAVATDLARTVERGREMEYVLEEGTLWQSVKISGTILLGTYTITAQYPEFRKSVPLLIQDGEKFSTRLIAEFNRLTDTAPTDALNKRTTSRDMNRLRRIMTDLSEFSQDHLPAADAATIRNRIIHDLAGLAIANPDDPEIAALISTLPRHPTHDLPHTPREAIRMDLVENKRKLSDSEDFALEEQMPSPTPAKRRRQFKKHVYLRK